MHGHGQDDEVGVTDGLVGRNGVSARGEHLDDQRDAIGGSRTGDGYVVTSLDGSTGDCRSHPAGAHDSQAPVTGFSASNRVKPPPPPKTLSSAGAHPDV